LPFVLDKLVNSGIAIFPAGIASFPAGMDAKPEGTLCIFCHAIFPQWCFISLACVFFSIRAIQAVLQQPVFCFPLLFPRTRWQAGRTIK
jgi:hypothetical protein